jgi:hypothetical protein
MKINVSFLAALILVGTDLVARAAIQGVEPALVLTASEYGYSWAKRLSGWARFNRESNGESNRSREGCGAVE